MNNKFLLVPAIAAILLLGFFLLDGDDEPNQNGTMAEQSAEPKAVGDAPGKSASKAPSIPSTVHEDDPQGDLRLEGLILDASDQPASGVSVAIDARPKRETKSGEDGTFFFDELPARAYTLVARRGGDGAGPVGHTLTDKSEPVILKLSPGTRLVARVRDEEGKAIAGASVEVRNLSNLSKTTDQDGIARFSGLRPGGQWVVAKADGFATASRLLQIADGSKEARAELTLRGGGMVEGVARLPDGSPAAGARVIAAAAARLLEGVDIERDGVTCDDKGKFVIAAVAAGTYRFVATLDDYPTATTAPIAVSGSRDTGGIEIQFEEGAVLRGSVVETSGQSVPYAQVRVQSIGTSQNARRRGRGAGGATRQATTDKEGSFEIRGLAHGDLRAVAITDAASSEAITTTLPTEEKMRLELSIEGEIAGHVRTSEGEPVSEAQVRLLPDFFSGEGDFSQIALRGVPSVRTDPGGRFRFTGLADGKYRVQAANSSSWQELGRQEGVAATVGDTDLVVVLDPDGGIRGRLRDKNGDHPTVFVVIAGWPPGVPVASDDGAFDVGNLPAGTYDITFRGPGFADTTARNVTVEPGTTKDLGDIEVARGRVLRGRVIDDGGSPVSGAAVVSAMQVVGDGTTVVSAFGEGSDQFQKAKKTSSDEDGTFTLVGVGETELVLVAEHEKLGRSVGVKIPAGTSDQELDLLLFRYGGLKGNVKKGDEPLGGARVLATHVASSGNMMTVAVAGGDGNYAFDRLPAGDYHLKALSGGGPGGLGGAQSSSAETVIEAGKTATADIRIDAGKLSIEVGIDGEGGAKIDAAQVFAFQGEVDIKTGGDMNEAFTKGGSAPQMTLSLGGKAASFSGLNPGPHSICVIPINGNLADPAFQRRLNEHRMTLAVHCRPIAIKDGPEKQSFRVSIPPMEPFPE